MGWGTARTRNPSLNSRLCKKIALKAREVIEKVETWERG